MGQKDVDLKNQNKDPQPPHALDDELKEANQRVARQHEQALVDEALEDSFPASDPPSYSNGTATDGGQPLREKPKR